MTVQRYRYRMTYPTVDMTDLTNKSHSTLAAVGQTQGQIIDLDVDDGSLTDLDDALAALGYVRIAGPGVVGVPGDAAEFVRRSGDAMDSGADLTFSGGGTITGLPLVPSVDSEAASKAYVDARVIAGRIFREAVLVDEQLLDGGSGGILQAALFYLASDLTAADTFVLSDGTTTETFTAVSGAPGAFQFQRGSGAATTQSNLITAINTDSTLWSAIATSELSEYFSGAPAAQFVVYRTAVSTANDRAYGTLASAASIHVVEFATGDQDYVPAAGTESNLPAADPAAKRFGFGRAEADVHAVETHFVVESNNQWTWDDDDQVWRLTGGTSAGSSALTFGAGDVASTTTVRYLYPGFESSIAQVTEVAFRVPKNGTLTNLYVRHNDVGAAGTNITYTLMVNGVATLLAVTCAANAADASNTSSSVVVSANDLISFRISKAGALVGARPRDVSVSVEFRS